ncbi:hypothetical protein CEXT_83901 [Caerostris extrusa]|uniref:Uncharacterized protein n=1 Tax=Caerostris extrusa TaxID=172846 RepID=A0AAV4QZ43_CAEEX|nr:hypothetical protein CEXT_83901 [Caerostris extrusa]
MSTHRDVLCVLRNRCRGGKGRNSGGAGRGERFMGGAERSGNGGIMEMDTRRPRHSDGRLLPTSYRELLLRRRGQQLKDVAAPQGGSLGLPNSTDRLQFQRRPNVLYGLWEAIVLLRNFKVTL